MTIYILGYTTKYSLAFDWSIFTQVVLELNVQTSYKNHMAGSTKDKNC